MPIAHEAHELPRQRGDDLAGGLALLRESPIPSMQSLLGAPSDRSDLWWQCGLQRVLPLTDPWLVSVVPGGLHEYAAQVRVAGLGDAAAPRLRTTRMLRRNNAGVAHDLRRALEAAEAAELRGESNGCHLRDSAQRLQRVHDCTKLSGRGRYGAVDRAFQELDSLRLVVDLHDVVEQRRVLVGVRKLERAHPLP